MLSSESSRLLKCQFLYILMLEGESGINPFFPELLSLIFFTHVLVDGCTFHFNLYFSFLLQMSFKQWPVISQYGNVALGTNIPKSMQSNYKLSPQFYYT